MANRVWQQRMYLTHEYWRDKAPMCLKGKPDVFDKCINSFHYLTLTNPKQASLGTCNCSAQVMKKKKRKLPAVKHNYKIDDWLKVRVVEEKKSKKICIKPEVTHNTDNLNDNDISGLDHKYAPAHNNSKDILNDKSLRIRTASEVVLEEQDRKKRQKCDDE